MIAAIRPQADLLRANEHLLNDTAARRDVVLFLPFRRWLETGRTRQWLAASGFAIAVLLTYYPGGIVLCVLGTWALVGGRPLRFDRRLLWIAAAALVALIPLVAALALAPVHTSRQLPTIALLTKRVTWTFYWRVLPDVVGRPALAAGAAGIAAAAWTRAWRTEAVYVASWILVLVLVLSLLPARDPRYVLLAAPAFVLAAALAIAWTARRVAIAPAWQVVVLAATLLAGGWSASRIQIPQVSGFGELTEYLHQQGPADAVLYDGAYDGLFGFYVRAADPRFVRRIVLANRLLFEAGPTTTFKWVQKSNVASTDDVVSLLRARCGCRWVAIEVDNSPIWAEGQRLLRQAVVRPGADPRVRAGTLVPDRRGGGPPRRSVSCHGLSVARVYRGPRVSVAHQSCVPAGRSDSPMRRPTRACALPASASCSRLDPRRRLVHESQAHELGRSLEVHRPLVHEGHVGIPRQPLLIPSILGCPVVMFSARRLANRSSMKVVQELEVEECSRLGSQDLTSHRVIAFEVLRFLIPPDERNLRQQGRPVGWRGTEPWHVV